MLSTPAPSSGTPPSRNSRARSSSRKGLPSQTAMSSVKSCTVRATWTRQNMKSTAKSVPKWSRTVPSRPSFTSGVLLSFAWKGLSSETEREKKGFLWTTWGRCTKGTRNGWKLWRTSPSWLSILESMTSPALQTRPKSNLSSRNL